MDLGKFVEKSVRKFTRTWNWNWWTYLCSRNAILMNYSYTGNSIELDIKVGKLGNVVAKWT